MARTAEIHLEVVAIQVVDPLVAAPAVDQVAVLVVDQVAAPAADLVVAQLGVAPYRKLALTTKTKMETGVILQMLLSGDSV